MRFYFVIFLFCLTASAALLSPHQASQPASAPMVSGPNSNRVDYVIASQLNGQKLIRWHGLIWATNAAALTIVDVTNSPMAPKANVAVSWQDQTTLLTTTDLTGGWREVPVTATRTVNLPQVAQQFFRVPVANQQVTLEWDAATDPLVTGYTIWWGTNTEDYTASLDTTNSFVTASGLAPNTTYYFAVTARDGAGDVSTPSAEIIYTTPPPAPPTIKLAP